MKLEPLQQFICDKCGEAIQTPEDGWLEWLYLPDGGGEHGFRIVHNTISSPGQPNNRCQYPINLPIGDMHLPHFLGTDGLVKLLTMLERPSLNQKELLEVIRRLHIPYYEEARIYWAYAKADGFFNEANEYWPYLERNLIALIKQYERIQ